MPTPKPSTSGRASTRAGSTWGEGGSRPALARPCQEAVAVSSKTIGAIVREIQLKGTYKGLHMNDGSI
eukprot:scaffold4889_cov108-Isochrysis_galbana.AAC.1